MGLDQVARADRDPIEPEALGREIEHALHHEHGLGPAGAAHRRDRDAIGVDGGQRHLVVRHAIGPGHRDRGEDRHDHAPGDEGAAVVHERVAKGHDPAVARDAQLDLVPLVALLRDRQQVLAARLDESHRALERAREIRHQDVLGVHDRLRPEAAADVLRDHAHRVLGQFQGAGEEPAQDLGRLRRRPHGDLAEVDVPARRDRPRLDRHPGAAVQVEAFPQHQVGAPERPGRIAHALGVARGHVAAGMHARPVGLQRVVGRYHRRQRLVLDDERVERVRRRDGALGDDEGHRLPRIRDDLLGKDLRAGRRDQARVRNEQRQPPERGHVGGHEDADDPRAPTSRLGVDPDDARVRVRAPVHRDVE